MRITRILADAKGVSHFAEHEVATDTVRLLRDMPPFRVTRFAGPSPVKFFAVPAELDIADWHTAPMRQLSIALNGTVEYETGNGEVRRFTPGEVVLVEDTTGVGHITRFAPGEQRFLQIPVRDDWPGLPVS